MPAKFLYTITVPALVAGQLILYDEETTFRNQRKFQPFKAMHVDNTSTNCNVEIMYDYSPQKKITVFANGTKDVDSQPFRAFSVKNTHASITLAAGECIILIES